MKKHVATVHEGQKTFVCPSGSNKQDIHGHMLANVHESQKLSFDCPKCSQTFSRREIMKEHVAIVHDGQKPFDCPHCSKAFGYKINMKRHMATVHDGPNAFSYKQDLDQNTAFQGLFRQLIINDPAKLMTHMARIYHLVMAVGNGTPFVANGQPQDPVQSAIKEVTDMYQFLNVVLQNNQMAFTGRAIVDLLNVQNAQRLLVKKVA